MSETATQHTGIPSPIFSRRERNLDGWRKMKLGDVVRFGNGKIRPKTEGEFPVYGGNGILGYVSQSNYEGEIIIIGRVGAYCGSVYFENRPIWISDNALSAKAKDNNDIKYIYFFLKNLNLNQIAQGSSHPLVTQTLLNSLDVSICDDEQEQKAIAEVLSGLDDKIDLLHRQNKTLEDMAQALFRKWFVEGADERWEEESLGEVVDCVNGVSYKSSQLKSSPSALVTLKSFNREGGFRMDGFKEFVGKYKEQQVVNEGDLVVAHTDITQDADVIGNPALVISNPVYKTMIISMDLVKVNPKYGWLSKEFLYSLMKTREFKFYCLGNSNGSTVLHLSKSAIPTYQFRFPPIKLIKEFTENAKSCFDKKFKNISQIHALENLRNTLLPKLMSGAVRVRFK